MPSEREALYAAVLAEPEADAPRLVYADWLEEHPRGEADTARAHFIRLEIEAENGPDDSPEREPLESAAAKLYNRFGTAWDHELPTWDEWYDSALRYRRGFPHELKTNFRKLFLSGGRLFQEAPIRSLVVGSHRNMATWNAGLLQAVGSELPDVGGLRELWIGPNVHLGGSSEGVRNTFQVATKYPSLANLRRLSFAGCRMDAESVILLDRALREAVFRETLVELDLSNNQIRETGANVLSTVPSLAAVPRVILTGNPLTPAGERMLRNHFGDRVVI
jgi:uncharacterized protein (TIGR02996 family)